MNPSLFYPLLMALPVSFLAVIIAVWQRFEQARGMKTPVKEGDKFLRAPGYSAFKRVEKINDEIDDVLFWFTVLPALVVIGFLALKLSGRPMVPYFGEITVLAAAVAFVWLTTRLISKIKDRNAWRLGYRGERAVGEYLNQLMLDGCRVFHDFPLPGNGNLDHVVVAPSGVYAVETKTKSKCPRLKRYHKVRCDGNALEFPDGWDTEKLAQARRQATQLGALLMGELKISVEVKPILTFPGWYVENAQKSAAVQVLNPKMIRSVIVTDAPPELSPEQTQQIAAFLDGKCRDVEF